MLGGLARVADESKAVVDLVAYFLCCFDDYRGCAVLGGYECVSGFEIGGPAFIDCGHEGAEIENGWWRR